MRNRSVAAIFTGALFATNAPPSLAEFGPAFTGMTGRADDASAAFFSPAGITRLERAEVGIQTIFVYGESRFDVDQATFAGGDADNDNRVLVIPAAPICRKNTSSFRREMQLKTISYRCGCGVPFMTSHWMSCGYSTVKVTRQPSGVGCGA